MNKRHGLRHTPEYTAWAGMKDRCYRRNSKFYFNYGGRGIKVCDRWLHSFESFIADMGSKPSPEHTIDRIDNDSNYEPNNCRWVTRSVNMSNRRTIFKNNKTGYRGVHKQPGFDKFKAQITIKGKTVYLGSFSTPQGASQIYEAKRKELHEPYKN